MDMKFLNRLFMTQPATLFIIAAPSGAGKTSLVKALIEKTADMAVSVSHTTRPQRYGEQQGVNYHFVDITQFEQLIEQQDFLEYATVFGNYYGTSKTWVNEKLAQGIDVILEIDWQGAQQVRKSVPDAVGIFILPPALTTLQQRLCDRGQDAQEVIATRLAGAQAEMRHYAEFDYLVINDDFSTALEDLAAIVRATRLKQAPQAKKNAQLLTHLLT